MVFLTENTSFPSQITPDIEYEPARCARSLTFVVQNRRVFSVEVVNANEDNRGVPDSGHVQAFMEGAIVGSTVTEEADYNLMVFTQIAAKA